MHTSHTLPRSCVWGTVDRHPGLRGYTGGLFEWEVLGTCRVTCHGYIPYRLAIAQVMLSQPYKPGSPRGEAGNLFNAVARKMATVGFDRRRLELYTAVGSTLDRFHSTDGFFRYAGVNVTLDTTLNPDKCNRRVHVIIRGEDALNGYVETANNVAYEFCLRRHKMEENTA